jgi:hypothetical protein
MNTGALNKKTALVNGQFTNLLIGGAGNLPVLLGVGWESLSSIGIVGYK